MYFYWGISLSIQKLNSVGGMITGMELESNFALPG